jgi:N-acetylglucosaminyl-diphospho-decaprenol L-rhamnosyltransferase
MVPAQITSRRVVACFGESHLEHEQPRVVAVVVAYDSARWLPACIEALDRQGIPIIVVDNASRDGTAAVARNAGARVIANDKNEGYGRGNNQGIRAAEGADWCMIVNPDAVLDTDCVRLLLDGARRHSRAAILVPKLVEPDGRSFDHSTSVLSQAAPIETEYVSQGERVVPFASGACMLVQRSAFLSIGGFDEHIFLFYEDDDLCLRIRQAGFTIVQSDGAIARHVRGGSTVPSPGRIFRSRWHQAWSRSYVCRKHGIADDRIWVLIRNGLKLLGVLPTFNRRRIERYAGSAAGAWAALRNKSALERERLAPRVH